MYVCNNCGADFAVPDKVHTTYESYYGVSGEFRYHTPITLDVCPYCGDDDFEEDDEYEKGDEEMEDG